MKVYFLDTSALVKLHIPETGSTDIRKIISSTRADPPSARVLVSRLAYPECMSAVVRRQNDGSISQIAAQRARASLAASFAARRHTLEIVEANPTMIDHAAVLVARHRMRGYDAVHLAAALTARSLFGAGNTFTFVSADVKLNAAAAAEKLAVHPALT